MYVNFFLTIAAFQLGGALSGSFGNEHQTLYLYKDIPESENIYINLTIFVDESVYQKLYMETDHGTKESRVNGTISRINLKCNQLTSMVAKYMKTASTFINVNLVQVVLKTTTFTDKRGPWDNAQFSQSVDARMLVDKVTIELRDSDHVIVLTSRDLFVVDGENLTDIKGITYNSHQSQGSISAVELTDNIQADAVVITHELAHSLGVKHDGDENGCDSSNNHIMSPYQLMGYPSTAAYEPTFSLCSIEYLKTYVSRIKSLWNRKPQPFVFYPVIPSVSYQLPAKPGQVYDVHKQCQRHLGPWSYFCDVSSVPPSSVCQQMLCYHPLRKGCIYQKSEEGTSCGNKMWCENKVCVPSPDAPSKPEGCIFGDRLGNIYQRLDCAGMIRGREHLCYQEQNRQLCCDTCQAMATGPPGCEYGDNLLTVKTCDVRKCRRPGSKYNQACCRTCAKPTTTTTTTTTTTAAATTTTTTTTTTTAAATTTTTTTTTTTSTTTTEATTTTTTTTTPTSTSTTTAATTTTTTEAATTTTTTKAATTTTSSTTTTTVSSVTTTITTTTLPTSTTTPPKQPPSTTKPKTYTLTKSITDSQTKSTATITKSDAAKATTTLTSNKSSILKAKIAALPSNSNNLAQVSQITESQFKVMPYSKSDTHTPNHDKIKGANISYIEPGFFESLNKTNQNESILDPKTFDLTTLTVPPEENNDTFSTVNQLPSEDLSLNMTRNTSTNDLKTDCEDGDKDAEFCSTIEWLSCCDFRSICCATCRRESEPLMCGYNSSPARNSIGLLMTVCVIIVSCL